MKAIWGRRALFLLGLFLSPCAFSDAKEVSYRSKIEADRKEMEEKLRAPDGWLSLIGLHWLKEGVNSFGSSNSSAIVLPEGSVRESAGAFVRKKNKVYLVKAEGSGVLLNGKELGKKTLLKPDVSNSPDLVKAGRIEMHLIDRSGKLGIRIKDPESPTRKHFKGQVWYPIEESFRVEAIFEPFSEPRDVIHPNEIGQELKFKSLGNLRFIWRDKTYKLATFGEPKKMLFIIFRDQSSGKSTYGGGRFLSAGPVSVENKTSIDFNEAHNPPCAFTKFATCPLAPSQNNLDFEVAAGEKVGP